ncbi:MAG: hypothetical protein JKY43_06265 [Phycisphaerales bacterium]|nr:hypothetical protein [Phycisphaerales bacterium]
MARCKSDESISRRTEKDFDFPLGVYPVESMTPVQGYSSQYEPADGDEEGIDEVEAWPDRYVFDIVISATRLEALWVQIFAMMPGRVYPILDYIGHDCYREIDPYIAYEPLGQERMTNLLQRYRDFFIEDGMVGFGAVSEEPFFYAFVDEHKILTLRVEPEMRPKIEQLLASFELEAIDEPAGADAAAHEHRSVLITPSESPELLNADEIVEIARERWGLVLNVDPETNLDDDGQELGITPFRCLLRYESDQSPNHKYAEVICTASCLIQAETLALEAVDGLIESDENEPESFDLFLLSADRVLLKDLGVSKGGIKISKARTAKGLHHSEVLSARWLIAESGPT